MTLLVLDASAAVEIALWTPDGARLAAHVATAETVAVPDHFHLECASALRRMELHHEIDTSEAQTALAQILALRVRRVDTAPLLDEAWGLRHNITVADGLYVVLARRLAVALVTGDIRLTRAPQLGIPVLTAATPPAAPDPSETGEQPPQAPGPAPAEQAENPDAGEQDVHAFTHVYLDSGWMRTLPGKAVMVLVVLDHHEPLTREALHERLRLTSIGDQGLGASAWEQLHEWTDEELTAQRIEFGRSSSEGEDSASAAEVMAEEAELRQARLAETDRYAAALGVAPVRTLGELVDLMVAARVLLVDEAGRYAINPAAPLPAEVLPLSAEEAATQDQMRWHDLHHATAQALIRLFDPDGAQRRDRLRTSLQKLARQVDAEVESVRAAVVILLDEGDFTASLDVTTIREHQVFELVIDWARFVSTRIGIRAASTDPAQATDPENPGAPR